MELYITQNELRWPDNSWAACPEGYRKLMKGIEYEKADVVRIPLSLILEVNGPYDADWALRSLVYMGVLPNRSLDDIQDQESAAIDAADSRYPDPDQGSNRWAVWDREYEKEWRKVLSAYIKTLTRSADDYEHVGEPVGFSYYD